MAVQGKHISYKYKEICKYLPVAETGSENGNPSEMSDHKSES
jgi:hypothetical protein